MRASGSHTCILLVALLAFAAATAVVAVQVLVLSAVALVVLLLLPGFLLPLVGPRSRAGRHDPRLSRLVADG